MHYIYIYICIYKIYVSIHRVPKCMGCKKAIVMRTGRVHCFHDCISLYIHV